MTASLVTRKRSPEEVCNSFLELENNLDSVIMTTDNENVRQHATTATELDVPYRMDTTIEQLPRTFELLERAAVRLTIANRLSSQHQHGSSEIDAWQVDSKKYKGPLEQQIRQIGNVQHIISVMGLLPGCYAVTEIADSWMEKDEKKLVLWNFPATMTRGLNLNVIDERFGRHKALQTVAFGDLSEALFYSMMDMVLALVTGLLSVEEQSARNILRDVKGSKAMSIRQLRLLLCKIRDNLELDPLEQLLQSTISRAEDLQLPPNPACSRLVSHRMQQLFRVLKKIQSETKPEDQSNWRGMIFVQQTLMAIVLEHVIRLNPSLSFFKCQSLTGHNGAILSASMEDQHQRRIVDLFRSGHANLLICTSVAEEGLDITQCSVVIRFDLPATEASYIQSRGRARKPGSLYTIFVNADDPTEQVMIANLRFAEQCMKQFASYRQQKDNIDNDEDVISGTQDADREISLSAQKAILAKSQDGNEAGVNVAVEMIYKYVNQLPQDQYCQLRPHLIFRSRETEGHMEYQYQLTLPSNAATTSPVLGKWCTSKQKAKKSACFAACVVLRSQGEMNERFYPISRKEHVAVKTSVKKRNRKLLAAQTPIDPEILRPEHATRVQDSGYANQAPHRAQAPVQLVLYLHVVTITPPVESGQALVEFFVGFDGCVLVPAQFGVLTLKKLDCLMNFPLYPETGDVHVQFNEGGQLVVSNADLVKLKKYHLAVAESLYYKTKLFTSVCREKRSDMESLIDGDVDFLPEQLKQFGNQIPNVNKSWYLLCPLKLAGSVVEDRPFDPLFDSEDDWSMEDSDEGDYLIDWETINAVRERVNRLHTPGIGGLSLHRCVFW